MNKKRFTIGLFSTIAVVAIPMATVISCGQEAEVANEGLNILSDKSISSVLQTKDIVLEVDSVPEASADEAAALILNSVPDENMENDGILDTDGKTIKILSDKDQTTYFDSLSTFTREKSPNGKSKELYENTYATLVKDALGVKSITFSWSTGKTVKFEIDEQLHKKLQDLHMFIVRKLSEKEFAQKIEYNKKLDETKDAKVKEEMTKKLDGLKSKLDKDHNEIEARKKALFNYIVSLVKKQI